MTKRKRLLETSDTTDFHDDVGEFNEKDRLSIIEKHTNQRFAAAIRASNITHEAKLTAALQKQAEIHTATIACIQDELDSEREEKERLKQAITEKDNVIQTLHDKLSIFQGIDAARALAEHINSMHYFINNMKQELVNASAMEKLDHRMELLLKDLHDSLVFKTVENYQCVFLGEEACMMGMKFTTRELGEIGIPVAKRVKAAGTDPISKHKRFVDGKVTMVNSYSPMSREIIRDELREAWLAKCV